MAPPPAPSERGPARAPAKAPVGLALGLLVATTFEVFGGEASVDVSAAGVVVEANTTLWPAWVGLALAIVAGLATLVPVLTASRTTPAEVPRYQ